MPSECLGSFSPSPCLSRFLTPEQNLYAMRNVSMCGSPTVKFPRWHKQGCCRWCYHRVLCRKQRFQLLPIFSSSSNPLYSIPPGHPSTHTPYHHTPPTPPTVTTSHWSAHPCHPQQYRLSVGIPRKLSSCADIRSTNPTSVRNPVTCWPTEESPKLIHISFTPLRQPEYAVHTTLETVDYALGREPSSSLDRTPHYCKKKHGGFAQFVWRMICTSRVKIGRASCRERV